MRRCVIRSLPLSVTLVLAMAGCMLAPVDGQVVTSTSSVIHFEGYAANPSEPWRIEAFDGLIPRPIANTTSGAAPERQYDGADLYKWSVDAQVPSSYWIPGTTGHVARVRAVWGASLSSTAFTFTSDWLACLGRNPDLEDFIENCQSPRSPNAYIYTSHYPTSVDLRIVNIRPAIGGGLEVLVRNFGRPGRITKVVCRRSDDVRSLSVSVVINPVETLIVPGINLGVSTGQTVLCNVFGVNEDGSAEADPLNNPYVKTF
jgi:hypothetical protein